ncbi:MAG: oligosaccharide flippase family protein [Sphingomonadales bacterium]
MRLKRQKTTISSLLGKSFIVVLGKVFNALLTVVGSAFLARLLSPGDLTGFTITFSLVSLLAVVAQGGLNQSIIRFVGEALAEGDRSLARATVLATLKACLVGSVLISILLYFFYQIPAVNIFFQNRNVIALGAAVYLWIIFLTLHRIVTEILRSYNDISGSVFFSGLGQFGGVLSGVIFIFVVILVFLLDYQINVGQIVMILASSSALVALLGFLAARRFFPEISQPARPRYKKIFWTSLPLLGTNILFGLEAQIGIWLAAIYLAPSEAALFITASRVMLLISFSILVINAVTPPLIVSLNAKKKLKELEKNLRAFTTLFFLGTLIMTALLLFFAEHVMGLLFGPFYSSAANLMRILVFGAFINVMVGSCGLVLMLTGQEKKMLRISLFALLLKLVFVSN